LIGYQDTLCSNSNWKQCTFCIE